MQARGEHLGHRVWWARWWAIGGAVVLIVAGSVAALVASSGSGHGSGSPSATGASKSAPPTTTPVALVKAQLAAAITTQPASGMTGVSLDQPVMVSTASGSLLSVQVLDASGAAVNGVLAPSRLQWRSIVPLQPTSTYRVVATVGRPDGITAQKVSTFTTLTPTYQIAASVFPSDGMTVGVGQPIVFKFDYNVRSAAGQAAAIPHIYLSMSKPVPGMWGWFSMNELHFRPNTFWPPGEKINVQANFDGWNAGLGRWGHGQINDTFTIGDARVSIANLATDQMRVTLNGATVATYPISGGRQQYPTMNGTHIVLDRESVVHMVSSTVGIPVNSPNGYDEFVYQDVHISDSGEYVHAAPWSVGAQGSINVSHGCINMSTPNATAFFNFSRVGDIVEVVGGPRPPALGDHGVMDWSQAGVPWTTAVVHQLA